MFEKIFGIFRKRKKADVSQQIPGDTGEDMFDIGEPGLEEDFDADTISLETGMSDGGFSSGSPVDAGGGFGEPVGVTEPPLDEDLGLGMDFEEEGAKAGAPTYEEKEPVSPLPQVEAFAPPKKKGKIKAVIPIVVVAIVGLVGGFFLARPTVELVQDILTSGPTLQQQLTELSAKNKELEDQLARYRAVGNIEDILAIKEEVQRRENMANEIDAIESRTADQAAVENRLDQVTARLAQLDHELLIQKGALANVQKAVKQLTARNDYLVSSTEKNLKQIRQAELEMQELKARLEPSRVEEAEAAALLPYQLQEEMGRKGIEALPPL
ncbi:MAG: hypothetical protein Kow0099_37410 [Candidatus Abyssubacteria bacterium]